MQRHQSVKHALQVAIRKVMLASLLQTIIPLLMPKNSSSDELGRDELSLVDNLGRVVSHPDHDVIGDRFPGGSIGLGGNGEGVDERLGMGSADFAEEPENEGLDGMSRSVNAGNDLACKLGPRRYRHLSLPEE